MQRTKYILVVVVPALFLFVTLSFAGVQKLLPDNGDSIRAKTSHVAIAQNIYKKLPLVTDETQKNILKQNMISNIVNAILCLFFMLATLLVCLQALRVVIQHIRGKTKIYPLKEVIS